jgi:hypothetical protein
VTLSIRAAQVEWFFEVYNGKGWVEVGSSYRLLRFEKSLLKLKNYRGSQGLYPGIPYPTPEARSVRVDIRLLCNV